MHDFFSKLSLCILLAIGTMIVFAGNDPEEDQYFPLQGDFAASHILIAYKGAQRAKSEVTLNKKQALAKANEIVAILAKDPDQFEELAGKESDGSTAAVGGNLKSFNKGAMAPPFERALVNLEIGEITAKPVKTQFGYHIIRRNALQAKYYGARAVLIAHRDAVKIRGISNDANAYQREKKNAAAMIGEIAGQITPENFEEILDKRGDLDRGFLGVFKQGDSALSAEIIDHVKDLDYGGLTKIVELPFGYAILQRVKVKKRAASQIWISYLEAANAPDTVTRTKDQAKSLANELCQRLAEEPDLFSSLAEQHSDGPFKVRGGRIPSWFAGYKDPAIEDLLETLAEEEIGKEPVETELGFFIIRKHAIGQ